MIPQLEELGEQNLSCEELALANFQSLTINQRVAAEAANFMLQLVNGSLSRFASYFNLDSASMGSHYVTLKAIRKALKQRSHSCG